MFSTLSKREIVILAPFEMSSANAFNLVRSKNLLFGKELINSSQLLIKMTLAGNQLSSFPTMISTVSKTEHSIMSTKALNLDKYKNVVLKGF